jgi:hypothetical protein
MDFYVLQDLPGIRPREFGTTWAGVNLRCAGRQLQPSDFDPVTAELHAIE